MAANVSRWHFALCTDCLPACNRSLPKWVWSIVLGKRTQIDICIFIHRYLFGLNVHRMQFVSMNAWNCGTSEKGKADPIESSWSWTEHLIFLLWKIQYYLDSNKGGKLLVQYVARLVTQKQPSVLSASPSPPTCCSISYIYFFDKVQFGLDILLVWINLTVQVLKLFQVPQYAAPLHPPPNILCLCLFQIISHISLAIPHFLFSPAPLDSLSYSNRSQLKHAIKHEVHIICQDWKWKETALGKIPPPLPFTHSPPFSPSLSLFSWLPLSTLWALRRYADWIYY